MSGLGELIGNPWLYVLIGMFIIMRNVFGAFPEPNPAIPSGFGSGSPGYTFIYRIARGLTGDLNAIGMNLKGAVSARITNTINPAGVASAMPPIDPNQPPKP